MLSAWLVFGAILTFLARVFPQKIARPGSAKPANQASDGF